MFEAVLLSLPRRGQTEDRLAVLCRDDATRREAAAVADPIHLVEDRPVPIAGPQEVGVQRMQATRFGTDRAVRSRNRLREHLTAEDVLRVLRVATTKQIFFERLDVEHVDDFGEHGIHCARRYHRHLLKMSRGEGSMALKIYGIPQNRTYRWLWMANQLGIPFERIQPDIASDAYKKVNPNRRMPAIDDDGVIVWESMAINLYLAKKYGKDKDLATKTPVEEALATQWSFWVMTECERSLL